MIPVFTLLLTACLPDCPQPEDRFDITTLPYEPSDGRGADTAASDAFVCSDGELYRGMVGLENPAYDILNCNLCWCVQEGTYCVLDSHFEEWWQEKGSGRLTGQRSTLPFTGMKTVSGVECNPL